MAGMRIAFGVAAGERLQCSGVYQCVASNNVCLLTVSALHVCVCVRPRVRVRSVVRVQRLTQCIAQLVSLSLCCIYASDRQLLNGLSLSHPYPHTQISRAFPHILPSRCCDHQILREWCRLLQKMEHDTVRELRYVQMMCILALAAHHKGVTHCRTFLQI